MLAAGLGLHVLNIKCMFVVEYVDSTIQPVFAKLEKVKKEITFDQFNVYLKNPDLHADAIREFVMSDLAKDLYTYSKDLKNKMDPTTTAEFMEILEQCSSDNFKTKFKSSLAAYEQSKKHNEFSGEWQKIIIATALYRPLQAFETRPFVVAKVKCILKADVVFS